MEYVIWIVLDSTNNTIFTIFIIINYSTIIELIMIIIVITKINYKYFFRLILSPVLQPWRVRDFWKEISPTSAMKMDQSSDKEIRGLCRKRTVV